MKLSRVYFRRQKFSFQTHKRHTKKRRQQMESTYGAGFWSVFREY